MRFNKETLDGAISHLLPEKIKKAIESGTTFSKPTLISFISEEYFILNLRHSRKLSRFDKEVYKVVVAAAVDLREDGCINYGKVYCSF